MLAAAGERQAKLQVEISSREKELADRKKARTRPAGGGGSGRMIGSEQKRENKLNAEVKMLRDGRFPGEAVPVQQQSIASLISSAQQHAAHHADAQPVPSGRPATTGGASTSASTSASAGTPAASTRRATGSTRDASSAAAEADDGSDGGDDDEQDAAFAQYYTITPQQRDFMRMPAPRRWMLMRA